MANPTIHVMPSAAPCRMRATNIIGSDCAYANAMVEIASSSSAPIIGTLRPSRSDTDPIGTDSVSSETPNDAKSKPIVVGPALNLVAKSGRTGTPTEYATRSVNVAVVMQARTTPLFTLEDQAAKRRKQQRDPMRPAMGGGRLRLHRAGITEIAATVERGIAVQKLEVASGLRHADDVAIPGNGRKVHHDDHKIARIVGAPHERHHAALEVAAVEPLEAGVIEVHLMKRGLRADRAV